MFRQVRHSFTRSARLVLDVREWFATAFGTGAIDPNGVPAIVRPNVPIKIIAEPTNPRNNNWPFSGPVELIVSRGPSGLLAFFGRVRVVDGPKLRVRLEGSACKLTITAPGYCPVVLNNVAIPPIYGDAVRIEVELRPGRDYPFPTGPLSVTTLAGGLFQPDGTPIRGAEVKSSDPELETVLSDEHGQWILVLDRAKSKGTTTRPVHLTITEGATTLVSNLGVIFQPKATNRMPLTIIRGQCVRQGLDVRDATIAVAPFAGATKSALNGLWEFYPPPANISGTSTVTITVTHPDGTQRIRPESVVFGATNDMGQIAV